jgi:HEAT repeat protein
MDVPSVRREAATALGRIKSPAAVPALLDGLLVGGDRFLEHALIFALIEIADRDATLKGLQHTNSAVRRGALIALDQMEGGNLTSDMVLPYLDPADPVLQQTALWVISHHSDWGKELVGFFRWLPG